ncbi:MAG: hypothetical protein O2887_04095 [Bacteroidetes bacterium]|nr:hypothetical protein [Bacteroidota bacterium]MDA1119667.1 hypothetical protein [Bacteroidota bacterium]
MKVSLLEIWHLIEILGPEKIQQIDLVLGSHELTDVSQKVIAEIKSGNEFDTELLPDLFTNSEIAWQPNEYASHKDCLAGINILKHQCEVQRLAFESTDSEISRFYADLIKNLEIETDKAIEKLSKETAKLSRILGTFRKSIYPLIKFLLEHPANHPQIKFEATLRQDFMAKTLFNEYHVKFSDLINPCWKVWIDEKPPMKPEKKEEIPEPASVEKPEIIKKEKVVTEKEDKPE